MVMWKAAESFPEPFRVWGSAHRGRCGVLCRPSRVLCVCWMPQVGDPGPDPCLRDDRMYLCTWRSLPRPQGHSLEVGRAFLPKSGVGTEGPVLAGGEGAGISDSTQNVNAACEA